MAITTGFYGKAFEHAFNAAIDWDTNTIKCALMLDSHTPDFDTHDFRNDTSAGEAAGQTAQTIPTRTFSYNTGSNYFYLDESGTVTFSGVTASQTIGGIIVYKDTGLASTDNLICLLAFSGGTFSSNGQDITVTFDTNGVGRITY